MEIALETFKKPGTDTPPENIGRSTVTIDEAGYLALSRLEQELLESGQREVLMDTDERTIQIVPPVNQSELRDSKIRVFLDEETRAGVFHVVARHARDNCMIYTQPTMVRLVAI
jgi:hypothetical protein